MFPGESIFERLSSGILSFTSLLVQSNDEDESRPSYFPKDMQSDNHIQTVWTFVLSNPDNEDRISFSLTCTTTK